VFEENKEFLSGERIYVGVDFYDVKSYEDHFDRYKFAGQYLQSSFIVVDASCGTGYGSEIISGLSKKVIGLDLSDHALAWAKAHHSKSNIEFKKADLNGHIDISSDSVDAIVSFETLEHVEKQEMMLGEFKRILKPGGILILSSPDKDITSEARFKNRFHIHELSKNEFVGILQKFFTIEGIYTQSKFCKQPFYKDMIKIVITKLDILRLRPRIARWLGLTSKVHKAFSASQFTPIQRTTIDAKNDSFVLIAVCRKR